jgi:integrase
LRHTGFRGSDAVGLRLGEIDWEAREINRLTLKRRKRVALPIHQELFLPLRPSAIAAVRTRIRRSAFY